MSLGSFTNLCCTTFELDQLLFVSSFHHYMELYLTGAFTLLLNQHGLLFKVVLFSCFWNCSFLTKMFVVEDTHLSISYFKVIFQLREEKTQSLLRPYIFLNIAAIAHTEALCSDFFDLTWVTFLVCAIQEVRLRLLALKYMKLCL